MAMGPGPKGGIDVFSTAPGGALGYTATNPTLRLHRMAQRLAEAVGEGCRIAVVSDQIAGAYDNANWRFLRVAGVLGAMGQVG